MQHTIKLQIIDVKSAPGDFRDDHSARCGKRRNDQCRLVAYSTGGMLIHLHAGYGGEIHGLTRAHDAVGQGADFPVGHPREVHRHEKSRDLVIWYGVGIIRFHQVRNLFGGKLLTVPLLVYQIDCSHEK